MKRFERKSESTGFEYLTSFGEQLRYLRLGKEEDFERYLKGLPKHLIEKILHRIPKEKIKFPEDPYKSILDYAKTWPEEIKERVKEILESAPQKPPGPSGPEFKI
jgi:hypothetical protein